MKIDNKELKNVVVNSYMSVVIVGIWGIILALIIISQVKSIAYTDDNCHKYNAYGQCIKYK